MATPYSPPASAPPRPRPPRCAPSPARAAAGRRRRCRGRSTPPGRRRSAQASITCVEGGVDPDLEAPARLAQRPAHPQPTPGSRGTTPAGRATTTPSTPAGPASERARPGRQPAGCPARGRRPPRRPRRRRPRPPARPGRTGTPSGWAARRPAWCWPRSQSWLPPCPRPPWTWARRGLRALSRLRCISGTPARTSAVCPSSRIELHSTLRNRFCRLGQSRLRNAQRVAANVTLTSLTYEEP